jgi:hypothetical protein
MTNTPLNPAGIHGDEPSTMKGGARRRRRTYRRGKSGKKMNKKMNMSNRKMMGGKGKRNSRKRMM